MNADYIILGNWQLAFAAGLILVNVVISVWLRLGLAKTLLVASARMVVQLLLVGFILQSVFELETPLPVLGIGLVMSALAGIAYSAPQPPGVFSRPSETGSPTA